MEIPEGIVSVKIDLASGCPARAGQSNTGFEFFRVGHVPTCENIEILPDIFNDAGGAGPNAEDGNDEEAESLF
jgi:hypothetical protein